MDSEQRIDNSVEECMNVMRKGTHVVKVSYQPNGKKKISKKTLLLDEDKSAIRYHPTVKGKAFKIPISNMIELLSGDALEDRDIVKFQQSAHHFIVRYEETEDVVKKIGFVTSGTIMCATWVKGLQHLLKYKDIEDEDPFLHYPWLNEAFERVDEDKNGALTFEETTRLLRELNISISEEALREKFQYYNVEGDTSRKHGKLTKQEFAEFFKEYGKHLVVQRLFEQYSDDSSTNINTKNFMTFLNKEQAIKVNENETLKIIQEIEPHSTDGQLSYLAFQRYLLLPTNSILQDDHKNVCQDMEQPLSHYFISSSHNTYLSADQWKGPSSVDAYVNALKKGCRCVELDCWNGDDGEPIIYHGHTLTSKILFKDVIKAIQEHAFTYSEYPLILSFENHCNIAQQEKMAQYLTEILGDLLYTEAVDLDKDKLPSPEELKGKILCKGKKLPRNIEDMSEVEQDFDSLCVSDEDEAEIALNEVKEDPELIAQYDINNDGNAVNGVNGQCTQKNPSTIDRNATLSKDSDGGSKKKKKAGHKLSPSFSKLVNYIQSVHFLGLQTGLEVQDYFKMSSLGEAKFTKLAKSQPERFNIFNRKYLTRTYPSGKRVDSSNYNPLLAWVAGCQIVAMNFQTNGVMMDIYDGMFRANGGCGYVLKPNFMMHDGYKFNSERSKENVGIVPSQIELTVISGHLLPKSKTKKSTNIPDPYVSLNVYGVREDTYIGKLKTKTIKNNGFNPVWNDVFQFRLDVPKLALLRFAVYDDDMGKDEFIGQCTLPYFALNTGYRSLKLLDKAGNEMEYTTLFVHVKEKKEE